MDRAYGGKISLKPSEPTNSLRLTVLCEQREIIEERHTNREKA